MRNSMKLAAAAGALAFVVLAANYFLLHDPVTSRLAADTRNAGIVVLVHYRYGVTPSTIVFDLRDIHGEKAPLDLWRTLFQGAAVLAKNHRIANEVLLQHRGKTVFQMKGQDFMSLGAEFEAGQNPVYLLRTLPEKLYAPDGGRAYESWTGGMLGVLGQQMKDLSDASQRWATGSSTPGEQ